MTKHYGTATTKHFRAESASAQPTIYQIRIEGYLDDQWTDWFSGLTITMEENADTLLTGPIADQAALEYPVPALSIPSRQEKKQQDVLMQFEAVQLFVARTRQHQPQFKITPENAAAVIDLCTVLMESRWHSSWRQRPCAG